MKSIIFEGDEAKCPECGAEVKKKENGNYPGQCSSCDTELIIGTNYIIDGSQKTDNNQLANKYNELHSAKILAYLLMIASTGFFLYEAVQFANAENIAREFLKKLMITYTVSYLITMFSLSCLIKIIDFLFDLDKHKSDK